MAAICNIANKITLGMALVYPPRRPCVIAALFIVNASQIAAKGVKMGKMPTMSFICQKSSMP